MAKESPLPWARWSPPPGDQRAQGKGLSFAIQGKTRLYVAPQLVNYQIMANGALYNWSCIDSQGVGTCQLGALSVIMRNAMIALYVITVYLGFGVNLVGAYINCQCVQQ